MSVSYQFQSDVELPIVARIVAQVFSAVTEQVNPIKWEISCAADGVWFTCDDGDRMTVRADGSVSLGGPVSANLLQALTQHLGVAVKCTDGTYPEDEIGG